MIKLPLLFGKKADGKANHENGRLLQEIADELTRIFGDLINKGADIEVEFEDANSNQITDDIYTLSAFVEVKFQTLRSIHGYMRLYLEENISFVNGVLQSNPEITILSCGIDPDPIKRLFPDHLYPIYKFQDPRQIGKTKADHDNSGGFAKDIAQIYEYATGAKPTYAITGYRGFKIIPNISDQRSQGLQKRLN